MNFELANRLADGRSRLHRKNVLLHPFAFSGVVLRKRVERLSNGVMGGLPTLGGLAVLDSEDEENISYDYVGNIKVIERDQFMGSAMVDLKDTLLGAVDTIAFLIEPDTEPHQDPFDLKTHDVIYLFFGDDIKTSTKKAYEIIRIEGAYNISPMIPIYQCNRRAEMDLDQLTENA